MSRIKTTRTPAATTTQEEVVDDPCWGSPDACSLAHLLSKIDRTIVLRESDDFLVLNKPPDLRMDGAYPASVHKLLTFWFPPPSLAEKSTHELLESVTRLNQHNDTIDNELRPCHQLDYATSGVLLVARNKDAANLARVAFEDRQANKTYLALVHGHLSSDKCSTWPVLTRQDVEEGIQQLEDSYRRKRGKRKRETFNGFQPPHSLFQMYKSRQSNGGKGSGNSSKILSPEEWQRVWKHVDETLDSKQLEEVIDMKWKQVKEGKLTLPFEQASAVYNDMIKDKMEPERITRDLPTLFRVQDEDDETFWVFSWLAETKHDFAMRLLPDVLDKLAFESTLKAGSDGESLDFKPSLTRCRILTRCHVNRDGKKYAVTKVSLEPRTGRRHQLRLHMTLTGHPIVGDHTYQVLPNDDISSRMCLHSQSLEIPLHNEIFKVSAKDPFIEKDGQVTIEVV